MTAIELVAWALHSMSSRGAPHAPLAAAPPALFASPLSQPTEPSEALVVPVDAKNLELPALLRGPPLYLPAREQSWCSGASSDAEISLARTVATPSLAPLVRTDLAPRAAGTEVLLPRGSRGGRWFR